MKCKHQRHVLAKRHDSLARCWKTLWC